MTTRTITMLAIGIAALLTFGIAIPANAAASPDTTTTDRAFDAAPRPTIIGKATVGQTLSALPGAWLPAPTLSYQWLTDGAAVAGAVDPIFLLNASTQGHRVSVEVTGTLDGYQSVSRSASTATVVALGAQILSAPRLGGVAKVGGTLSAASSTSAPGAVLSYRWYANGTPIAGASDSAFVISSRYLATRLAVRVTSSAPGYATVATTSAPSAKVVAGTLAASVPIIEGDAYIGHTLCASAGTWTAGSTLTYHWYLNGTKTSIARSCVTIGASSWKGKRLLVRVTGTKAGYVTKTMSSSPTSPIVVPGRTDPVSVANCPSWAPIKGNASSMIYHMPGQRFYKITHPEDCFSTESAARAAGYRKAKV